MTPPPTKAGLYVVLPNNKHVWKCDRKITLQSYFDGKEFLDEKMRPFRSPVRYWIGMPESRGE
jgi:hypothetical protein